MITAEKDFGHLHATKDARAGVLRILQASRLAVRLLDQALRVAEHARDVSDYCIDDNHGRHLAAVADEVADRQFKRPQTLANPFVEPLIAAAQQQQPFLLRQLPDELLIESSARRGQHDEQAGVGRLSANRLDGVEDRLAHHHHAGAAAEGPVVDALVLALGPVADVPQMNLDQAVIEGELQEALAEVAVKDLREQGEDVKSHGVVGAFLPLAA